MKASVKTVCAVILGIFCFGGLVHLIFRLTRESPSDSSSQEIPEEDKNITENHREEAPDPVLAVLFDETKGPLKLEREITEENVQVALKKWAELDSATKEKVARKQNISLESVNELNKAASAIAAKSMPDQPVTVNSRENIPKSKEQQSQNVQPPKNRELQEKYLSQQNPIETSEVKTLNQNQVSSNKTCMNTLETKKESLNPNPQNSNQTTLVENLSPDSTFQKLNYIRTSSKQNASVNISAKPVNLVQDYLNSLSDKNQAKLLGDLYETPEDKSRFTSLAASCKGGIGEAEFIVSKLFIPNIRDLLAEEIQKAAYDKDFSLLKGIYEYIPKYLPIERLATENEFHIRDFKDAAIFSADVKKKSFHNYLRQDDASFEEEMHQLKEWFSKLSSFYQEAEALKLIPAGISKGISDFGDQVIYRAIFVWTVFSVGYSGDPNSRKNIVVQAQSAISKFGISPALPVQNIFPIDKYFDSYSFEDLPRILELYFTPNVGPLPKIASTKPRGVTNNGAVCYAISVYQALANFFPLIQPVNLKPDAPLEVLQFVSIMNGLLTPSNTIFDLETIKPDIKSGGDSRHFFYSLSDVLSGQKAVKSGLNFPHLINLHWSECEMSESTQPGNLEETIKQKRVLTMVSKAPVLVVEMASPDNISKILKLPTFPPKDGPLVKFDTLELHALVCSTGVHGHAFAFVKRADNQWHLLDDAQVFEIPEDSLPLSLKQQKDPSFLSKLPINYNQALVSLAFYLKTGFGTPIK